MKNSIILNTEQVNALQQGRVTVRVGMTPQPSAGIRKSVFVKSGLEDGHGREISPPYQVGQRLYCRESWRTVDYQYVDGQWSASVQYKADMSYGPRVFWADGEESTYERTGWRSPVTMPKSAARLWVTVANISVDGKEWVVTMERSESI